MYWSRPMSPSRPTHLLWRSTAAISNSFTTISKACDNFLMHPDEGSETYCATGDCAPALYMIPDRHGADVCQHDRRLQVRAPCMATALLATLYGALLANLPT